MFKLLTLTAKALHLNGEHSQIRGTFDTNEVSIGRHAGCDVVLPDPSRRISRVQARILHSDDGQYVVCNVSTSNPMYVNGVKLVPGSSQVMSDGDELRAGSYVVVVSLADGVAQPAPLPHDGNDAFATLAAPVGQTSAAEQERVLSNVDPLLALGAGTDANVDPFADLLSTASPFTSRAGQAAGAIGMQALPPPMSSDRADDQPVSEESLPVGGGNSEMVPIPVAEFSPVERRPFGKAASPLNIEPRLLPTGEFDPDDPFCDLLTHALPVGGMGGTTSGMASGSMPSPLPRQGMGIGSSILNPERNVLAAASQQASQRQPESHQDGLENLLESPVRDASGAPHAQQELADPTGLAGDPFADLMGAPVESHIANAPPFDPVSRTRHYIPADFNPLAVGGVSQRNSSDPLTPMGLNARGLSDVVPDRTIDSIYNPSSESPTTLTVDPLQHTQERVLRVEQSVDPLKLFGNDRLNLVSGKPGDNTGGSVRDDAREIAASFRAPIPKFDPVMLPDEPAGNIHAPSPAPESSNPLAPAAGIPADARLSEPVQAVPFAVDTESSTPIPAPSADFSGMVSDAAEQKPGPDPIPLEGVPGLSVPSSPADTKPSIIGTGNLEARGTDALMTAFKHGAGLEEWSAVTMTPELMETLGRLLRTAVQGAVSLLAARSAIKQELHLSVTLINPKSNNPLKFLPDGHTALLQMLGPKIPGFITPVDAMEEAFDDLLTHQTAIAAGTQAMIEALFHRFDPDSIESRYPKSGMREKLSQTKYYAKLWNTYTDQYRLIKEEAKDDFFKRLGAEFQEAYNREYDHHANGEKTSRPLPKVEWTSYPRPFEHASVPETVHS